MEVQILSRKLIPPSSPDHEKTLKLTFLDQFVPPQIYVSCLLYYLPGDGDQVGVCVNTRNEQLQKSLSETLTLYYPFAGRYSKGNLFVDCNDEGAEYIEARVSDYSLSQVLEEGIVVTELCSHMLPQNFKAEPNQNTPLLKVQCNMFECGGMVIAVSMSHMIADAFTFFAFINSWAAACRVGIEQVQSPYLQLPSLFPARDLSFQKPVVPRSGGLVKVADAKRFVFGGAAISNLKDSAMASGFLKHKPTGVEVVTALAWKTLIKVSQARHGYLRPSFLAYSINMRGKTRVPVPDNCCGNFVGIATAKYTPEDDEGNLQIDRLISKVHDGIRSRVAKCEQVSTADDLFLMAAESFQEACEEYGDEETDVCVIVSWCRLRMYDADFGWGKPSWVSYVSIPSPRIMLLDAADGEGIEAWVSLDEHSLQLFEEDPDIRAFSSAKNHSTQTCSPSLTS